MKFRGNAEENESREDVREIAEALSLFGSAMRHIAERRSEEMAARPRLVAMRPHPLRLRLMLAPALAAAAAVAVAIPAWTHFHTGATAPAPKAGVAVQNSVEARASVSDTVLMNQIDNNVSEDVPDALEPLAQLSEQTAATNTTVSEEKNGSQK